MPKFDQAFLKISKEHTLVDRYAVELRQAVDTDDFKKLQEIAKNLRPDFEDHFKLEETIIFPAALLCLTSLEISDLIIRLTKEHGLFECDIQTILQFLDCESENESVGSELKVFLGAFLQRLEKHARSEMEDLFPRLDANKRAQKIVQDLLEET